MIDTLADTLRWWPIDGDNILSVWFQRLVPWCTTGFNFADLWNLRLVSKFLHAFSPRFYRQRFGFDGFVGMDVEFMFSTGKLHDN